MVGQFFIAFSAAVAAVILALIAIWVIDRRRGWVASTASLARGIEPIAFLFHDRVLIDATAPARALLHTLPGDGDWQRLSAWLSMRLPESAPLIADWTQPINCGNFNTVSKTCGGGAPVTN